MGGDLKQDFKTSKVLDGVEKILLNLNYLCMKSDKPIDGCVRS
jgi:hypothetical protein